MVEPIHDTRGPAEPAGIDEAHVRGKRLGDLDRDAPGHRVVVEDEAEGRGEDRRRVMNPDLRTCAESVRRYVSSW